MALLLPAFGGSKVTVTLRVAPTARVTPSSALQFALKSPTVLKARPLIWQAGDGNATAAVPVLRTTSVLVMGNAVVATVPKSTAVSARVTSTPPSSTR